MTLNETKVARALKAVARKVVERLKERASMDESTSKAHLLTTKSGIRIWMRTTGTATTGATRPAGKKGLGELLTIPRRRLLTKSLRKFEALLNLQPRHRP